MDKKKPTPKVAAVILAAGRGGRIGYPKIFLRMGNRFFWEMIVSRLKKAGIEDRALVIRPEHQKDFSASEHPILIVNRRPDHGMFSSVKVGLNKMKGYHGYLICPVDHPLVSATTYRKMIRSFCQNPQSIIRPIYRGKPGHPILLPRKIARLLVKQSTENRLDLFLKKYCNNLLDINVFDKHILSNINIIKDLKDAKRDFSRDSFSN